VVAVLTRPDARAGRGRTLTPSPVAQIALDAGIEVLRPPRANDPEFLARLAEIAPQAAPIVAFGGLIPPAALAIPAHGWINLHFSLLPAWRGAAPVQHAILAGDAVTGASTFLLEEGLDTGPVFGVVTETIRPTDTAGDLLARLAVSGAGLLVATLDAIASQDCVAVPQPAHGVSRAPKILVDDARVKWTDPAMRIDRLIRSCTPAPGSWAEFRDERVKLGPVTLDSSVADLAPGELLVSKAVVWAGTGSCAVRLGEVRGPGRRAMPAADWARGVRVESGERFG
jgi:methionyl-tRNA formyltransferase